MKAVAAELGNKPATCRKYYVHPLIAERYLDGGLDVAAVKPRRGMRQSEERLMRLIGEE